MNKICLDTSGYSNFKRGVESAVAVISEAKTIIVPAVVLGELRSGFKLGNKWQKNETELRTFLESPIVQVSDADNEASFHYSEIYVDLRKNGTPVPTNDIWIAAIALKEGAQVLTYDKHFELIRKVGTVLLI